MKLFLNKAEIALTLSGAYSYSGMINTIGDVLIAKAVFSGYASSSFMRKVRVHKGYAWTPEEVIADYEHLIEA